MSLGGSVHHVAAPGPACGGVWLCECGGIITCWVMGVRKNVWPGAALGTEGVCWLVRSMWSGRVRGPRRVPGEDGASCRRAGRYAWWCYAWWCVVVQVWGHHHLLGDGGPKKRVAGGLTRTQGVCWLVVYYCTVGVVRVGLLPGGARAVRASYTPGSARSSSPSGASAGTPARRSWSSCGGVLGVLLSCFGPV